MFETLPDVALWIVKINFVVFVLRFSERIIITEALSALVTFISFPG